MASAVRRSAFQCRHAPSRPSVPNTTASPRCRPPIQSRPHCQLKYWIHIPICAPIEACRWLTGGLPYCWRVTTSHSACPLVGSPSLIGGKCAERIGRDKDTGGPPPAPPRTAPAETPLGGPDKGVAGAGPEKNTPAL